MVFKRGKIWWMRFSHHSQQIRRSTGATTKKAALEFERKVQNALGGTSQIPDLNQHSWTFKDLMIRYLTEHSKMMKRPSSFRRDRSLSAHLLKTFGEQRLHEIRAAMIVAYKTRRRMEGAAPRSINLELGLMQHAFNKALREFEWVEKNPVTQVSRERVTNTLERWLREDEEQRLLAASPSWLQDLVSFALNTGLRQGEIINLQWDMVDLFRKTVTLTEQKNQAIDTLPLNQGAMDVIMRRSKVRSKDHPYVFSTPRGSKHHARNLLRAFYQACRKAQVESFRFHDLRHTFASRLVQRGVDLYTVQKLGRWKTLAMVQRYAHHNPESLRSGVAQLDHDPKKISTI